MADETDEIETARLAKLRSFGILDSASEREFDVITWLARSLLDCPIAAVSLIDSERQWFKAKVGLDVDETPRDQAFCAHAMHCEDVMVVEDARLDARFAENPLVTAETDPLLFYAGVPLRPPAAGFADDLPGIGTLCVADTKPRSFSTEQIELLQDLAAMVSSLLRARADAGYALELAHIAEDRAIEADRKNRQLRQAERMAGIGSWRFDLGSGSLEWSDQVFAIHGLPLLSDPPTLDEALNFYKPEDRDRISVQMERAATRGDPFDFESDFTSSDGSRRRVRSVGECEFADGKPIAVIGVFQDVTESHGREEVLRRSAFTDSLTGLPNRAAFELKLDENLAAARRDTSPLALLLLDLDGFKAVNDSFGHDAGDEVLRVMAERLRSNFANTFAARLGGDEFVMLVSRPRDCAKLERFIGQVLGGLIHTVNRGGESRSVSATIGAARLTKRIGSAGELLRSADLALYEAKRAQRGTGRIFGSDVAIMPDWEISELAQRALVQGPAALKKQNGTRRSH